MGDVNPLLNLKYYILLTQFKIQQYLTQFKILP